MTPSQRITLLKRLIEIHGAAQVSAWLSYRDTRAVKRWIKTRRVPGLRTRAVDELLTHHNKDH